MGKKAKKAAAARAAKVKADRRDEDKRRQPERLGTTDCNGSTLPEQHRQRRVEESEFFRVASLFGIAGEDPSQLEFKHPLYTWPYRKDPDEVNNPIYNAMWEAIPPEYDLYQKYRRAFAIGRAPFEMSWGHACRNMMLNALSRLRHKRKQRKFRDKKMANDKDNKIKSTTETKQATACEGRKLLEQHRHSTSELNSLCTH